MVDEGGYPCRGPGNFASDELLWLVDEAMHYIRVPSPIDI